MTGGAREAAHAAELALAAQADQRGAADPIRRRWLDEVANARVYATTNRAVAEACADETPTLLPLPAVPYAAVLRLERRVSHAGTVSVGGNLYGVPDTTRRRVLDVHVLADRIRIYEDDALVADHLPIDGRGQTRLDPGHRKPRSRPFSAYSTKRRAGLPSRPSDRGDGATGRLAWTSPNLRRPTVPLATR